MGEAEEHLSKVCKRFAKIVPNHAPYPTTFEKKKDPSLYTTFYQFPELHLPILLPDYFHIR